MRQYAVFAAACLALPAMVGAAETKGIPPQSRYSYADIADLALGSPMALEMRVRKATKIGRKDAPNTPQGHQRFLLEGDVEAAIRSPQAVPPRLSWLYDAPADSRGKLPKLNKQRVIIFANGVAGRPGSVQLGAPDSLIPNLPQDAARVRAILKAALAGDAPPEIEGVGSAFHAPGTLEGEGESQIFVIARDGRPLAFTIVRTPGAPTSWSVSADEMVDASATRPRPDTLLWYRLACFLPATLPPTSSGDQPPEQAQILAEDYRTVMTSLGRCARTRKR